MKINTKKRSKKPLLIALVAVIVLLGGYTAYAATQSTWPFTKTETKSHHDDTTKSDDDPQKSDTTTNDSTGTSSDDNNSTNPPSKAPPQYDPNPGQSTPKDSLTGVINYKAVNNGNLVLRTTINQDVSSGTCALTLTNTSTNKVYRESVGIIQRPSASNCNGFTIPLSKLGNGTWDISIALTSGNKAGTLTGNVIING